MKCQIVAGPKI